MPARIHGQLRIWFEGHQALIRSANSTLRMVQSASRIVLAFTRDILESSPTSGAVHGNRSLCAALFIYLFFEFYQKKMIRRIAKISSLAQSKTD